MIQDAINKINEEMEKNKNNTYLQAIGQYVVNQLEINKNSSDKIERGEKTLGGSLKYMQEKAKKVAVNGCTVFTDAEGFKIIDEYFEFTAKQDKILNFETQCIKKDAGIEEKKPVEVKQEDKDMLKSNDLLNQLLGGYMDD